VPSNIAAEDWLDIASGGTGEDVQKCVEELQNGKSRGPFVFANRYDGIDLPNDSCRLLILAGLPRGIDSYETYLGSVLGEGSAVQTTVAQRIEQGAGRSTRGAGDYSVVLFVGEDLAAWIGRASNLKLITQVTRLQFEIGIQISKSISEIRDLLDTVAQCLTRDIGWRKYYAESLAELSEPVQIDSQALNIATSEREYFRLLRRGEFDKATSTLESLVQNDTLLDHKYAGWILQLGARAAYWGKAEDKARQLQDRAFDANATLIGPKPDPKYVHLDTPSEQAEKITRQILEYKHPMAYLAHFDDVSINLNANVSGHQFEEALKELGAILGYETQRPEREFGRGSDVLWLLEGKMGWIIEVKSNKEPTKPLTKKEHGQLLDSFEWFKQQYAQYEGTKVIVHPNDQATPEVNAKGTMVLTLNDVSVLASQVHLLLEELCNSGTSDPKVLKKRCETGLRELGLKSDMIRKAYLKQLKNVG
jgi:hypothetical protein